MKEKTSQVQPGWWQRSQKYAEPRSVWAPWVSVYCDVRITCLGTAGKALRPW